MVLTKIKEIIKNLSFAKKAFTKGGFRHVGNYISGLIASAKKTVKKISKACPDENHSSALNRLLSEAKFKKEELEQRYLKKVKYIFKGHKLILLIDDTLVERNGEHIEEAQKHFDHSNDKYIQGHQFLTAILYTPFLQLPLFPELYSKNTDSKIAIANELISKLATNKIPIHTVLFDSWYSDRKLLKLCLKANMRVICGIKSNRNIRLFRCRNYNSLSFISKRSRFQKLSKVTIDDKVYYVWSKKADLNKLPNLRLVISHECINRKLSDNTIHLISTNPSDNIEEVLRTYKIRWNIETYHRDIKQNLGFAKAFFRKKEGIVRHAIFVAITYAALSLFMYERGMVMSIGNCCEYLRDKAQSDFISEIIMIEDPEERIWRFNEAFINETRKL